MGGKWLEALKEVSPWLVRIAVLYSPKTAPYAGSLLRSIAAAAPSFAIEPIDTPIMKLRRHSRRASWSACIRY
jgi:putative tryptophan/tyrosine transport system substrate-binding protein